MPLLQTHTVALGEMVGTNVSLNDTFNHSRSDVFSTYAGSLEVSVIVLLCIQMCASACVCVCVCVCVCRSHQSRGLCAKLSVLV